VARAVRGDLAVRRRASRGAGPSPRHRRPVRSAQHRLPVAWRRAPIRSLRPAPDRPRGNQADPSSRKEEGEVSAVARTGAENLIHSGDHAIDRNVPDPGVLVKNAVLRTHGMPTAGGVEAAKQAHAGRSHRAGQMNRPAIVANEKTRALQHGPGLAWRKNAAAVQITMRPQTAQALRTLDVVRRADKHQRVWDRWGKLGQKRGPVIVAPVFFRVLAAGVQADEGPVAPGQEGVRGGRKPASSISQINVAVMSVFTSLCADRALTTRLTDRIEVAAGRASWAIVKYTKLPPAVHQTSGRGVFFEQPWARADQSVAASHEPPEKRGGAGALARQALARRTPRPRPIFLAKSERRAA